MMKVMINNTKIKPFLIFFSLIFFLSFFTVKAHAACNNSEACSKLYPGFGIKINPNPFNRDIHNELNITTTGLPAGNTYRMYVDCVGYLPNDESNIITSSGSNIPYTFIWTGNGYCYDRAATGQDTKDVCLRKNGNLSCYVGSYRVTSTENMGCNPVFKPPFPDVNDIADLTITLSGLRTNETFWATITSPGRNYGNHSLKSDAGGIVLVHEQIDLEKILEKEATYKFFLEECAFQGPFCTNVCEFTLTVFAENENPEEPPEGFIKVLTPTPCQYNGTSPGIETALGCFPTQPKTIIEWLLKYGLMIGGGIAFLLMLFGGFQLITSTGDPEKLKKGQEVLFSALAGLLLIIFAVFILRFIGVTILEIPDWG